jgi:hypothetical protein
MLAGMVTGACHLLYVYAGRQLFPDTWMGCFKQLIEDYPVQQQSSTADFRDPPLSQILQSQAQDYLPQQPDIEPEIEPEIEAEVEPEIEQEGVVDLDVDPFALV